MSCVEFGSSSCNWLPCVAEGNLTDRVCPYWRMAPGLLALASTIIAIVCALIWNCPYLHIAFAPGALASCYFIYLGWDFKNIGTISDVLREENGNLSKANIYLKQLTMNLEQKAQAHVDQLKHLETSLCGLESAKKENLITFSEYLKIFTDQIKLLEKTRSGFEQTESSLDALLIKASSMFGSIVSNMHEKLIETDNENSKMQKSVGTLGGHIEELKSENAKLSRNNENLRETVLLFETKSAKQIQHLQNLENSLREINTAVKEDHTAFSVQLKIFVTQVELLKESESSAESLLVKASEMMSEIFTQINIWKDDKWIATQLEIQQKLHNSIAEMGQQLARQEGQAKVQAEHNNKLEEIKEGYEQVLEALKQEIDELGIIADTLQKNMPEQIEKLKQVANVFESRMTVSQQTDSSIMYSKKAI